MSFNIFKKTCNLFISKKFFYKDTVKYRIIFTIILIIIDIISTTLIAYYFKLIINSLSGTILYNIWVALLLLGFFWILEKTIIHIQEIIFFPVINFSIKEVTYKVVDHIHQISLVDYQKLSIPEVVNSIRRISVSARVFLKVLVLMLVPTLIKLLIAIYIAIKMGFLGLLLIPIIIFTIVIFYQRTKTYMFVRGFAWKTTDQVISRINESILNTKMIRSFKAIEMEQVCNLLAAEAEIWYDTNTKLHSIHIMVGILLGICITIILSGVILGIQKSRLTIGDFVFLKSQLIAVWIPFKNLVIEFRQLGESLIDIKKIIEILNIPKINTDNKIVYFNQKTIKTNVIQDIYLDNISFSYNKEKNIFQNLSLSILTGEKIGIIGEIGSGKSTLINLMSGIYKPSKGIIYIKGIDSNLISKEFLQTKIYCIQQDFKLFNASLFYNITYGIENFSLIKLENFINNLQFMEFVKQMPLRLNTIVGEKGIKLSGGEQQKIALCRALLLKPEILFLDETTNSLSYTIETEILNLLFKQIPTVILVSHRINKHNYLSNNLSKVLNL